MKTIVTIRFGAHRIPGGEDAILGQTQCGPDVAKINKHLIWGDDHRMAVDVELTLDSTDERLPQVLGLLAIHGEDSWIVREDVYTEDELQAAPLLVLNPWGDRLVGGGQLYGTKYDISNACQRCGTGARQTSPLVINAEDLRKIEKLRIAATLHGHVVLHDVDVEKLIAAGVTGTNFWPAQAISKNGHLTELRREQLVVENILPPMAPSSSLDRSAECPICHRGCSSPVWRHPLRFFYRREDLADIKDVNLTWEWFGNWARSPEDALAGQWPDPRVLVTPKVMNLLRGKTKKEQKYQGCDFIPIWIEDDSSTPPRPAGA